MSNKHYITFVMDICGIHDKIRGCSSSWSNEILYGVKDTSGCRENFLRALRIRGLSWKDIVLNVNFFCNVWVFEGGKLAETVFTDGHSNPGDYVKLRAEVDTFCVLSNCSQVTNPCNASIPTAILVVVWQAAN